jgi:hypothetical protein
MGQLRTVSIVVVFFVIEPPFLASIFLACAAIAIICFVIAAVAGYFLE